MSKNILRFFCVQFVMISFFFICVQAEEMNSLRNAEPEDALRNSLREKNLKQEEIDEIKINPDMRRADAEQIIREENMAKIKIVKGLAIKLPDGKRTSIKEIREDGDIILNNGLELTPDGYALSGEFAGRRLVAPEETGEAGAPVADKGETAKKRATIAEMLANMPDMVKAAQSAEKLHPEAKKTVAKKGTIQKPKAQKPTPEKPVASAQNKRLFIPPEAAKNRSVSFMNGCWSGGSVDYTTKRKVTMCFCFNNARGTAKIYDPGFFGTSSAPALAKILTEEQLLIHTWQFRKPNGRRTWIEQDLICRNKGKTAFCTEKFIDGRGQSFETSFARAPSCP